MEGVRSRLQSHAYTASRLEPVFRLGVELRTELLDSVDGQYRGSVPVHPNVVDDALAGVGIHAVQALHQVFVTAFGAYTVGRGGPAAAAVVADSQDNARL